MHFHDRVDAGRQLGERLRRLHGPEVVVLALPRGGVPVGEEVARVLDAPLEVLVVRKLGAPTNPELGYGALAEGGELWIDADLAHRIGVTPEQLERTVDAERDELVRRVRAYRGGRPLPNLQGKVVIVVDDGLATGSTARAALRAVRERGAATVVLAVPVLPADQVTSLLGEADELVSVHEAADLVAVGAFYEDFSPTSDAEVLDCLARARGRQRGIEPRAVAIAAAGALLQGDLAVPAAARGVILFAHGSGSNRFSPRNGFVARHLNRVGLGTLMLDLFTDEEAIRDDRPADVRSEIELLAGRLIAAARWLRRRPETAALPVGYFGSSTGAAVALAAAALAPWEVEAVVCRGGRPDLAGELRLKQVVAPTLLLVGDRDPEVLTLNRSARQSLPAISHLAVVPGAGHLFEGPGQLDAVAHLAAEWFERAFEHRAGPSLRHAISASTD